MSESLAVLHHRDLQARERQANTDWLESMTAAPVEPMPERPVPDLLAVSKPKRNALSVGMQRAWETANEGAAEFLDAVWGTVAYKAPHPEAKGFVQEQVSMSRGVVEAPFKAFNAVMKMLLAPGVGLGASGRQFLENIAGTEKADAVLIPGGPGSLAAFIRSGLGGGAAHKPGATAQERAAGWAPITVGEAIELVGLVAGTPLAVKGAKAVKGRAQGKGATAAPADAPVAEPVAEGADVAASMAEANRRGRQPGSEVTADVRETIADQYRRGFRGLDAKRLGERTLEDVIAEAEAAAAEAVRTATPEPKAKPAAVKPIKVESVKEITKQVGEADVMADPDALASFVRGNGGLKAPEGGGFEAELALVPKAFVNKRKGITPDAMAERVSEAVGREVNAGELLEALTQHQKRKADKEAFIRREAEAEGRAREVAGDEPPSDVADLFLPGEWQRMPEQLRRDTIDRMRAESEMGDPFAAFKNEDGAVRTDVLARMAVLGLLGAATGEDAESSIRNALLGAGLGLVFSRVLAKSLAARLKASPAAEVGQGAAAVARGRAARAAQAEAIVTEGAEYRVNLDRIDADPATKAFIEAHNEALKADIIAQKRGKRSLDTTEQAGRDLISTGKMDTSRLLALEPGAVLNAEEITAARMLDTAHANLVAKLQTRLAAGEPIPAGELKRAAVISGEVHTRVRAVTGELGRAVGAHNITVPPVISPARLRERMAALGDVSEADLAEVIGALRQPERIGQFSAILTALPGAIQEAMYGAMLSGKALVRNAIGNSLMMPLAAWERSLAAYMPTRGAGRVAHAEGAAMFRALYEGWADHLRMLRKLDVEGLSAEVQRFGGGKVEGARAPRITAQAFGLDEASPLGTAVDYTGKAVRTPLVVMDATDAMSKAVNGRMELHAQAVRQAVREGAEGEAFTARVTHLVENPGELSEVAREQIVRFREDQTFTRDFQGRVLRAIQDGPPNEWAQLAYRMLLATFVRTPLRIAEAAIVRTPGLNAIAPQFWTMYRNGGADRQIALARLGTGTAIIGSFMYLAYEGVITGTAPKNPAERAAWLAAGYQELSWWDPVSRKWRSYAGLEPLTTLVATGADIARGMRLAPGEDWESAIVAAALSQLDALDARSYTQSVSEFVDLVRNPNDTTRVENGLEFMRRKLRMFSPAVLAEVESAVDPEIRRGRPGSSPNVLHREAQALLDSLAARVPFFSEDVPAERNLITGDPIVAESFPYNPFMARTPKQSVVFAELRRLRGAGLRPLPEYLGRRDAQDPVTGTVPEVVRLSPQQRDRWHVLMTREVKDPAGRNLHDHLREMLRGPLYQQASEVRKVELWQEAFARYRRQAEVRLRVEDADVRERFRRNDVERRARRQPARAVPSGQQQMQGQIRALEELTRSLGR